MRRELVFMDGVLCVKYRDSVLSIMACMESGTWMDGWSIHHHHHYHCWPGTGTTTTAFWNWNSFWNLRTK